MKTKKQEPEILNFNSEDLEIMKQAVSNVSKRTYICNNSITYSDNQMIIEDTRAFFLISVGMEYQKLLNQ